MGAVVFLAAGTACYLRGWIFLATFGGASLAITLYLAKRDPALLERRTKAGPVAERQASQKIIQLVANFAFLAILAVPALDHRFRWSHVPLAVSIAGDALVALGFVIVFRVFVANTFTSATIEIATEQRVVDTGPYARVRHPMYAGALVLLAGVPLALGSLWGLLALVPISAVIVWRLLDEERFLTAHLPGYAEYRRKTPFRLVPRVW